VFYQQLKSKLSFLMISSFLGSLMSLQKGKNIVAPVVGLVLDYVLILEICLSIFGLPDSAVANFHRTNIDFET
jgi:hypothetical protein